MTNEELETLARAVNTKPRGRAERIAVAKGCTLEEAKAYLATPAMPPKGARVEGLAKGVDNEWHPDFDFYAPEDEEP
jgi:hypothetical protein